MGLCLLAGEGEEGLCLLARACRSGCLVHFPWGRGEVGGMLCLLAGAPWWLHSAFSAGRMREGGGVRFCTFCLCGRSHKGSGKVFVL